MDKAHMAKYKKMTDSEIVSAVEKNMTQGVGYHDSKLSRERQRVLKYYQGELPKPHHSGNSKYVSMDVYDTVESAKSQILEVFSNDDLIKFDPEGPEDVQGAKVATVYTNYVINRQNPGFEIMETVVHDALMSRNGIVKVYWDDCYEETEEEFSGVSPDDAFVIAGDPDVDVRSITEHEDGTVSGVIVRKKDTSHVRIDPIPAEEFVISPRAKDIRSADFVAHRTEKTEGELIKEGYPASVIRKIASDDSITYDDEKTIRFNESSDGDLKNSEFQQQARTITVVEAYMKMDALGTGVPQYWKVIKAGSTLLDKEQVNRHPFKAFTPLPLPHSFWGASFASKAIPIQNARTTLIRGILDHTVITNNPRTIVVKGALVNPREMLENRVGGIVNVTRPDGIMPMPQAGLNPFVFQTIQLLDEDKEDTTGVSKLSQGLNKDAISSQNAQGMVEQLIGLSQQRQKIIARNFAQQFLKELYIEVYQLVIENEDTEKVIEVAGQWVPILPSEWRDRTKVSTAFRLGYGEKEKDAQETLMLHQLFSQDPATAPMYDMEKRYNLLSQYLEKKGCKNVDDYLLHPSKIPPPQPDPQVVHQMEMDKADRELEARKIALSEQKAMADMRMDEMENQLKRTQTMLQLMLDTREQDRKEFDSETRAATADRELDIVENTKPSEVKQSNIISPNS